MNELEAFFDWASDPKISTSEVKEKLKQLKESGAITVISFSPLPKDEELVFIQGKPELFWRHMIELRSFEDIRCWTDGEVVVVPKNDKDAVQYILQCLNGKFVNRQLD